MLRCSVCHEVKSTGHFSRDRSRCAGFAHRCRVCDRAKVAAYTTRHKAAAISHEAADPHWPSK